jgi:hypothetical protein
VALPFLCACTQPDPSEASDHLARAKAGVMLPEQIRFTAGGGGSKLEQGTTNAMLFVRIDFFSRCRGWRYMYKSVLFLCFLFFRLVQRMQFKIVASWHQVFGRQLVRREKLVLGYVVIIWWSQKVKQEANGVINEKASWDHSSIFFIICPHCKQLSSPSYTEPFVWRRRTKRRPSDIVSELSRSLY